MDEEVKTMKPRIYLDTSVISAYFDDRWPDRQRETTIFFNTAPEEYSLALSITTLFEIRKTKDESRRNEMLEFAGQFELVPLTEAAEKLALDFQSANLVPANKFEDALHLATAVERGFEFIASWNFSHMVNAKTQKRLPVICAQHGYFHQTLIYCPSSF